MAMPAKDLATRWNIGESVFDVLIGGTSFLDSREGFKGSFHDGDSAERFLHAYGYDILDPIELAELQGNLQEAVRFIRRYFLKPENPDGLQLELPKKFTDLMDVRELLLHASSEKHDDYRHWACAILRVVHAINHIDRDIRTQHFSEIQKQIFDRFYRYLHRTEGGQLFIGRSESDPLRVDLVEFQVKPKKARDSTLMKLLHKPESVAEELFDRVGVRFITKDRVDAVRVIHFLEQAHVIVAANIKPSRSRNTLVDTSAFKDTLQRELPRVMAQEIEESQLDDLLEGVEFKKSKPGENPFSSEHYRAIQFTCRQLIKIRSGLSDQIRELKISTKNAQLDPNLQSLVDRIAATPMQRVTRFFYPFEIQVLDQLSFIENERGRSAHGQYKKSQQQAALFRVMGSLATDDLMANTKNDPKNSTHH
jgi:uncharacterized protein (TIGR04562 family)